MDFRRVMDVNGCEPWGICLDDATSLVMFVDTHFRSYNLHTKQASNLTHLPMRRPSNIAINHIDGSLFLADDIKISHLTNDGRQVQDIVKSQSLIYAMVAAKNGVIYFAANKVFSISPEGAPAALPIWIPKIGEYPTALLLSQTDSILFVCVRTLELESQVVSISLHNNNYDVNYGPPLEHVIYGMARDPTSDALIVGGNDGLFRLSDTTCMRVRSSIPLKDTVVGGITHGTITKDQSGWEFYCTIGTTDHSKPGCLMKLFFHFE